MKLLLDTCVLSEYIKSKPHPTVIDWLDNQNENSLFISAISLAEIRKGMFKIRASQPQRYAQLVVWLANLEQQFAGRILAINDDVLIKWSEINGLSEALGKKLAIMDSLIAATALLHQATVVTRNVQDFALTPVRVINPWLLDSKKP